MPRIFVCVHPIHDPVNSLGMFTKWDLYIHGVTEVHLISLKRISPDWRIVQKGSGKTMIVACEIGSDGSGRFPVKRDVQKFLSEIRAWGYKLTLNHPAGDGKQFSMCTFTK